MYNKSLFPLLALKVLKDATMHTTWLRSLSSRPTAQCGTRLSLSPASRWHTCCPASLWSERSRRSSVPVQTAWAKPSERTGLTGRSSSVTGYWLCSIHPKLHKPQHSGFFHNHHVFESKGQRFVFIFFPFLFSSDAVGIFFPLTAFCKPLSLKLLKLESRGVFSVPAAGLWLSCWFAHAFWAHQR